MRIDTVSDIAVLHCHNEPRVIPLKGMFFRLQVTRDEFSQLSEEEIKRLTKRWSQAYTFPKEDKDPSTFYLRPKPRWRFLAERAAGLSLKDFRHACLITETRPIHYTGREAYDLFLFLFGPGCPPLFKTEVGLFNAANSYEICYESSHIEAYVPAELMKAIFREGTMFHSARQRLFTMGVGLNINES